MRVDRLIVKNFRNLADIDLELTPTTVIVGENRSGKSNLLKAIRLVLDPSMSYLDRQLTRDDFWDGLSDGTEDWDPMAAGEVIEISIEIVDFDDEPAIVTALSDALIEEEPLRARLTYRFAPQDTGEIDGPTRTKYRGHIVGGNNIDQPIAGDLRGYLYLAFLPALRDVESDIKNWRRSPLRRLLEAATEAIPEESLASVRKAMQEANKEINDLDEIRHLGASVGARLLDMVGENHALETELAVAPEDPIRLIRNMRIYIDGVARRGLAATSLGAQNILYLALLELGLDVRLIEADIAHVIMAVEEPEAHLHPHLQRLIFGRILGDKKQTHTTIVTTHSPQIASVASPKSLAVMRSRDGKAEISCAHTAALEEAEWDDVSRYLDVTRAELIFARGVLFVEGYAEQVIIPKIAQTMGVHLDKIGISVCAVHGTHFETYVRFCNAINIPWAVVTDGDSDKQESHQGKARINRLMGSLVLTGAPSDSGIFIGDTTFEYDLLVASPDNIVPFLETLGDLTNSGSRSQNDQENAPDHKALMRMIDKAGGKGRFAQRLALRTLKPPKYVADAINYLVDIK